ncbi:MAG: YcjX family protein [Pseudomonadota bacterium]
MANSQKPIEDRPPRAAEDGPAERFSLGGLADDLLDSVDRLRDDAGSIFESSIRIGVTGLAGSGKTVFITALALSLLHRDRMRRFGPAAAGLIEAALLRPQPNDDVPRFAIEAHEAALRGQTPAWPASTRSVSELRISLRLADRGFFSALTRPFTGPRIVNIDIVDYPGEWLMDLPLMDLSYEEWSAQALAAAAARPDLSAAWTAALAEADPAATHTESAAEALAKAWAAYLQTCRDAGLSTLAPGRFLMPGDYEGSPALSFAPLPRPNGGRSRGSLWREMRRRFEAYKRGIVTPFFRRHFAKLDRQVVLVDALSALARGPQALEDMTDALGATLACFRHGRASWLERLIGAARIDRLLVAATKADRLHHSQHPRMTALIEAMVAEAVRRAAFSGAETRALALSSIRSTAERELDRPDGPLPIVHGQRQEDGRDVALHTGDLPANPASLLAGGAGASDEPAWDAESYAAVTFRPPRWGTGGPPHIRLDAALDFLLGDRLG